MKKQECYSVCAACGSIGTDNINRDGLKNHVCRDAVARSMEDPCSLEKGKQEGGIRLKRSPASSFYWIFLMPLMLSLVQVPRC